MTIPIMEEGDLVEIVTLLTHKYEKRDLLIPGTRGIVTEARPGARFIRVDFFEPGDVTRWVSPASLRLVEEQYATFEPPVPDTIGELWDIVSAQACEIQRLQRELSNLQKETGARLAHAGVDGS